MKFRDIGGLAPIGSIERPTDFDQRVVAQRVAALARDIRRLGGEPINPILVSSEQRDGRWVIVAGRDRFAAVSVAGLPAVPIRVVEGATTEELADLEEAENLLRRDVPDRDAKLVAYVARRTAAVTAAREKVLAELYAKHLAAGIPGATVLQSGRTFDEALDRAKCDLSDVLRERGLAQVGGTTNSPTTVGKPDLLPTTGRLVTPKGEVVRDMAAATGRKVAAVEREIQRAEIKASTPPVPATPIDPLQRHIDAAIRNLRAARGRLLAIGWLDGVKVVDGLLRQLAASRQEVGEALKGAPSAPADPPTDRLEPTAKEAAAGPAEVIWW